MTTEEFDEIKKTCESALRDWRSSAGMVPSLALAYYQKHVPKLLAEIERITASEVKAVDLWKKNVDWLNEMIGKVRQLEKASESDRAIIGRLREIMLDFADVVLAPEAGGSGVTYEEIHAGVMQRLTGKG